MCAIFGILSCNSGPLPDSEILRLKSALSLMESSLERRGPDGRGEFVDQENNILLGHRRLAILGKSDLASQPIKSSSGRWILSFNGQIYNYLELAGDLGISRSVAVEGGDSPVLAELFERFGQKCVNLLDGMFAIAAWDRVNRQLFLLRDRFGIKPIYWYFDAKNRLFIFASQLGALLASGLLDVELDRAAFANFLKFGALLAPQTMIDGVNVLEPGSILSIDFSGNPITKKFWPTEKTFLAKKTEIFDPIILRDKFLSSLEKSTRSDVPFGLFLSGGIDSSAIACGLAKLGWTGLKTFTLGFDKFKGTFDESTQAKKLSKSLGFQNFVMPVKAHDLADNFQEFVQALDRPSVDGFNTFLVSKLASKEVKVALSGLGGDELFFGYPQMRQFMRFGQGVSGFGQTLLRAVGKFAKKTALGRKILEKMDLKFLPAFVDGKDIFTSTLLSRELFSKKELESLGLEERIENFSPANIDLVDLIRLCELRGYTGPVLLGDSDLLSMNFGLELRVPFLNNEFFDEALSLKKEALFSPFFDNKSAFCQALEGFVPAIILNGQKRGFVLPMGDWIVESMMDRLNSIRTSSWIDGLFVEAQIKIFIKNKQNWRKVWALLVFDQWFKSIKRYQKINFI